MVVWFMHSTLKLHECVTLINLHLFQAPPKAVPKTIENQRVYDETTVDPNDEEVTA